MSPEPSLKLFTLLRKWNKKVSHLPENKKNSFWDRVGYGLKFIDSCSRLYELIIDSGEVLDGHAPRMPPYKAFIKRIDTSILLKYQTGNC